MMEKPLLIRRNTLGSNDWAIVIFDGRCIHEGHTFKLELILPEIIGFTSVEFSEETNEQIEGPYEGKPKIDVKLTISYLQEARGVDWRARLLYAFAKQPGMIQHLLTEIGFLGGDNPYKRPDVAAGFAALQTIIPIELAQAAMGTQFNEPAEVLLALVDQLHFAKNLTNNGQTGIAELESYILNGRVYLFLP